MLLLPSLGFYMSKPLEDEARPHVLLLATQPWPVGARLGMALRAVGFRTSIWCTRTHPMLLTDAVHRRHPYRILAVRSLEAAILTANPDLIVPCDEPATANLQELAERAGTVSHVDSRILPVIRRSLGPNLNKLTQRAHVLKAAGDGGAPVPANAAIATMAELRAWLNANGFPAYLKADGTFGGVGVRLVHTYEEAEAAFRSLDGPPRTARVFKRLTLDLDPTLLMPLFRRHRPALSVQRSVPGVDVNSAIFCWEGRVWASLTMQVVQIGYEFGPSTVLRRIRNATMDRTAEILASRLNLSGFYGLDFILDEQTGVPWLLEMNSRATQIPHLALGPGHDLPAAAFAAVTGLPIRPRPPVTTQETIALFPQEWDRDPASPLIRSAYHDVPWEAPALVRAYVRQRPEVRRLITRSYWRHRKGQKLRLASSAEIAALFPKVKL